MPRPYSIDLRKRVLQYLESNHDKKKARQLFQIGIATIHRWIKRKKQRGNIEKYGANRKTKIRDLLPSVASLSVALDLVILSM